jgi:hypothetical protein
VASAAVPYWKLIAVLHSTVPLVEPLALRLFRAALELRRENLGKTKITGDLATGEVRSLGRDLLLGSIGGPGFEAELDTPRGHGLVRFLLTREGLDLAEGEETPPADPSRLN